MKGMRRANEWTPVHSSIAGSCHFVLAKDIWYRPVVFRDPRALGLCALVLRICSDCRQRTRLAAAIASTCTETLPLSKVAGFRRWRHAPLQGWADGHLSASAAWRPIP
ncbi:hypothetical protein chiPu_0028468 [Chiloscyllium punctatum]|uniref:Uncharacterized protein n=1 Tax=Chiloscyllium punctatum TaxID=137246 RepID=A0A401TPQ0_CHIPU|nr:hypothetical protein [Chiloscyllium punctatum]